MTRFIKLAAMTVLSLPISGAIAQGPPPPPQRPVAPLEYAVKFVCGRALSTDRRPQMASGNYYTIINVHNPNQPLELSHKVALARVVGERAVVTGFSTSIGLRYDEAVDLDCPWIERQLAAAGIPTPGLFTGFVVLQTRTELDVVAVYSAAPTTTNQIATMHTERVPVRRLPRD